MSDLSFACSCFLSCSAATLAAAAAAAEARMSAARAAFLATSAACFACKCATQLVVNLMKMAVGACGSSAKSLQSPTCVTNTNSSVVVVASGQQCIVSSVAAVDTAQQDQIKALHNLASALAVDAIVCKGAPVSLVGMRAKAQLPCHTQKKKAENVSPTSASAFAFASLAATSLSSLSCLLLFSATAAAPACTARAAIMSWKAFSAASRASSCFWSVLFVVHTAACQMQSLSKATSTLTWACMGEHTVCCCCYFCCIDPDSLSIRQQNGSNAADTATHLIVSLISASSVCCCLWDACCLACTADTSLSWTNSSTRHDYNLMYPGATWAFSSHCGV